MDQLKKSFRPEFLNRLDNIVVFRMLNLEDMQQITEIEIGKVNQRLADKQITLTVSESALEKLTRDGFDPEMGARPLRRVIQQQIEDPLSDALLAREFSNGDQVLITLDDKNEIAFRKVEPQREEL